jgi:hypothetical protein
MLSGGGASSQELFFMNHGQSPVFPAVFDAASQKCAAALDEAAIGGTHGAEISLRSFARVISPKVGENIFATLLPDRSAIVCRRAAIVCMEKTGGLTRRLF